MHHRYRNALTCTHIFPDTHRCGSPALRGDTFCYYHHPTRRPAANPRPRRAFQLPALNTKRDAQLALAEIIHRIAANQLDPHRTGLLLYSLQLAARTLPPG